MRPLSPRSETRLRPSFLRTTPARKPRTECCCHPVAVTIAAIVTPEGVWSIATIRACLVSGRAVVFDEAGRIVSEIKLAGLSRWGASGGLWLRFGFGHGIF